MNNYLIPYCLCIILSSISVTFTQNEQCIKVQCQMSLQDKKCITIQEDTALMKQCTPNQYCFTKTDVLTEDSDCLDNPPLTHKGFPGMSCKENSDCFSNSCHNNICLGIKENSECKYIEDCEYGFTCRKVNDKSICTIPLEEGNECSSDTDCKLTHGCYKNKCTAYFSFDDGQVIDDIIESPLFSFCKSGYTNPNNQACVSLNLESNNVKCDDMHPCRYSNDVIIPNNCRCGYNPNGDKYCLLGSGHYNYTRYITKVKEYYFSKGHCHLAERGGEGCLKDLYEGNTEIKDIIDRLYNAKVWALSNSKLIDAPPCALNIQLPKYHPAKDEIEPIAELPHCAKYQCIGTQSNCAQSTYQSLSNITVVLSDICDENSYCSVGGSPNEIFYQQKDITGHCEARTVDHSISTGTIMRYPGEDCTKDTDCTKSMYLDDEILGKCINSKCSGYSKGDHCKSTEMCIAGYYCDTELDFICKAQASILQSCKSTYDCQNNLLCYNNKCQNLLHTKEPGEVIENGDPKTLSYYCAYGVSYGKTCVKYTEKNKSINSDYTLCSFGTQCEYQYEPATFGVLTKPCGCGYNSRGQGYCPLGQDSNDSGWRYYYSALKKQYDNLCHSLSRYNCYLANRDVANEINKYRSQVIDGHLYYNSESCAQKVLSSINLSISIKVIIILVLSII